MLLASMQCGSCVLFCELMVEGGASRRFALGHLAFSARIRQMCSCHVCDLGSQQATAASCDAGMRPPGRLKRIPFRSVQSLGLSLQHARVCARPGLLQVLRWARIGKAFCPPLQALEARRRLPYLAWLKSPRPSLEPLLRLLEQ